MTTDKTKWERSDDDDKWVCWWCDKKYNDMLTRNSHVEKEHPDDPWIVKWIASGRPAE